VSPMSPEYGVLPLSQEGHGPNSTCDLSTTPRLLGRSVDWLRSYKGACWKELTGVRGARTISADGSSASALKEVLRDRNQQLPPMACTPTQR
jgi:hypothetical protein